MRQWLGDIANVIQIVSAVPFIVGAYWFFTRARRYKREMQRLRGRETERPAALVLSLSGTDISPQVQAFLTGLGTPMRLFQLRHEGGVTEGNILGLLGCVLKIKQEMTDASVTEVHLFLGCPVAFAAGVGAVLDNWVPVKVYQLNTKLGRYELWTQLHKGYIPGLEPSPLAELTREETAGA